MENGAQVIQVFESWAHQMIPSQFETFAKPYADLAMSILKERHPEVPVIYFANGGSSYLESQRDTQVGERGGGEGGEGGRKGEKELETETETERDKEREKERDGELGEAVASVGGDYGGANERMTHPSPSPA